jgi:hypothetical protein
VIVGAFQVSVTFAKFEVEATATALVIFWKFVVALFEFVAAAAEITALMLGVSRNV